jgi:leucyl/phenylalanyl-tRNA--protein transferase
MKSTALFKYLLLIALFGAASQPCFASDTPKPPGRGSCEKALTNNQDKDRAEFFPNTKDITFDERGEGLVTDKVALTPETVIEAYQKGIFPWADYGETAGWYALKDRGIIDFADLHIPNSLKREIKKSKFQITFDRAFEEVIRNCATIERQDHNPWIAEKFIITYTELYRLGYAHSVEVWLDGALVGGLYGVHINGAFSGESMFHKASNASKFALLALIEHLQERGIRWMDTQQVSSFPRQIGAKTIPHSEYLERLDKTHAQPISFYSDK